MADEILATIVPIKPSDVPNFDNLSRTKQRNLRKSFAKRRAQLGLKSFAPRDKTIDDLVNQRAHKLVKALAGQKTEFIHSSNVGELHTFVNDSERLLGSGTLNEQQTASLIKNMNSVSRTLEKQGAILDRTTLEGYQPQILKKGSDKPKKVKTFNGHTKRLGRLRRLVNILNDQKDRNVREPSTLLPKGITISNEDLTIYQELHKIYPEEEAQEMLKKLVHRVLVENSKKMAEEKKKNHAQKEKIEKLVKEKKSLQLEISQQKKNIKDEKKEKKKFESRFSNETKIVGKLRKKLDDISNGTKDSNKRALKLKKYNKRLNKSLKKVEKTVTDVIIHLNKTQEIHSKRGALTRTMTRSANVLNSVTSGIKMLVDISRSAYLTTKLRFGRRHKMMAFNLRQGEHPIALLIGVLVGGPIKSNLNVQTLHSCLKRESNLGMFLDVEQVQRHLDTIIDSPRWVDLVKASGIFYEHRQSIVDQIVLYYVNTQLRADFIDLTSDLLNLNPIVYASRLFIESSARLIDMGQSTSRELVSHYRLLNGDVVQEMKKAQTFRKNLATGETQAEEVIELTTTIGEPVFKPNPFPSFFSNLAGSAKRMLKKD